MNKTTKIALIAALPFLWACQTEHDFRTPASEGDEAVFVIGQKKTRTMYANDQWDATKNQELYWGNYIDSEEDNIRVFCWQGGNKVGTYNIVKQTVAEGEQGSPLAAEVKKTSTVGVQWGPEKITHTFYAFYPAELAGETMTGPNTITATILNGQSPKAFLAKVANGTTYSSLVDVANNKAQNVNNRTDIFCQPDMENAAMVARTDMSAEQYGREVPLDFNVIADVLDVQVNGPIIPNQLGGNAAGQSRNYINIYDVSIVHKDGKAIVGTFDLDMSTSKATNLRDGDSRILIQLAQKIGTGSEQKRQVPTLFARATKTDADKDDKGNYKINAATDVDHLRVRAFLAPGVVKNLNELQVVVSTDCGDYTQSLGDYQITTSNQPNGSETSNATMVAGQIHRLKLGYFMERGKSFDYTQWMSQLDPTIYINELSIPGSWHSTDTKYQGSTIAIVDQYNHGLRAFQTNADCKYVSAEYSNPVAGTPEKYQTPSTTYRNLQPATTADDRNPSSRNDTRKVKANVTFTQTYHTTMTRTVTKRIYTVNNTASLSMITGLTNLLNAIRSTEFAIVEIGSEYGTETNVPKLGGTSTATRTGTKTITLEVEGTQHATRNGRSWSTTSIDWNEPTDAQWATVSETDQSTGDYTDEKEKITDFVGGITYLLEELANVTGTNGAKLFTGTITPSTTIKNVRNHLIIKINTNSNQNNEIGWPSFVPALFSRWTENKEAEIGNVPLKWGGVAPETAEPNGLIWVFSEQDKIGSITNRQTAWGKYVDASLTAYDSDAHNAWFEFSAGGYDNSKNQGVSATTCQTVALTLNPWLLSQITDPTRQACPLGLVFFNYAVDPDNTYSSESLIRTIINNNGAFPLRRAETRSVGDNNNSFFNSNPNNPLKP